MTTPNSLITTPNGATGRKPATISSPSTHHPHPVCCTCDSIIILHPLSSLSPSLSPSPLFPCPLSTSPSPSPFPSPLLSSFPSSFSSSFPSFFPSPFFLSPFLPPPLPLPFPLFPPLSPPLLLPPYLRVTQPILSVSSYTYPHAYKHKYCIAENYRVEPNYFMAFEEDRLVDRYV